MKKLLLVLLVGLCGTAIGATLNDAKRKAVAQKLIADEVKIKDAAWSTPGTLLVGVLNDGSNRDGYANYVCEVLYDEGLKGKKVIVKVIDIGVLVSKNKRVTLGQAICK
jgi:subtilisin family serine protease